MQGYHEIQVKYYKKSWKTSEMLGYHEIQVNTKGNQGILGKC